MAGAKNERPAAGAPFGFDRPVFVVGEAGSNWRAGEVGGDEARARELIDVAAAAGCDAVKFQVFRAATIYAPGAGESDYLAEAGIREDIIDILAGLEMPYEMIAGLAARASDRGLQFMATAFSVADARAVDPYVNLHKTASYELNHLRLLEYLAATGKPVLMSTGAATYADIQRAVDLFRTSSAAPLALLQCTAAYPAPPEAANLRAIPTLEEMFGVPVGLSDHSADPVAAPAAAVALGARVVEKHFTLDRTLPGPDHAYAVEPDELAAMVRAIRLVEKMRGTGEKEVQPAEEELFDYSLRAIQATRDIAKGETLEEGVNVDILRPGKNKKGMNPFEIDRVSGRRAARDVAAGDGIQEEDLA
ncbi:MAG: N-acetylneuraminate synthase family protein [Candidatus Coatesbacteria bacterium]|nr:MAG: N-acetylneuraminate synthase family protein [Candidatus Coatesbacteria bacterium]